MLLTVFINIWYPLDEKFIYKMNEDWFLALLIFLFQIPTRTNYKIKIATKINKKINNQNQHSSDVIILAFSPWHISDDANLWTHEPVQQILCSPARQICPPLFLQHEGLTRYFYWSYSSRWLGKVRLSTPIIRKKAIRKIILRGFIYWIEWDTNKIIL